MPEFQQIVASSVSGNAPMQNTPVNPSENMSVNAPVTSNSGMTNLERKVGGKLSQTEGREQQPEEKIQDRKTIDGIERVKIKGIWYRRKK